MRRNRNNAALAGNLMLSPLVASLRMPLMLKEASGVGGMGTETLRAVSEKSAAMAEGAIAAQVSLAGSMMSFWPDIFSGRVPKLWSGVAAEQSMNAALRPAGRRVRANYKRLTKS